MGTSTEKVPSLFTVALSVCVLPFASVTTSVTMLPCGKSVVPLNVGVSSLPLLTGVSDITGAIVSTTPSLFDT